MRNGRLFTIHHSPFTIHHSPFTIQYSPFSVGDYEGQSVGQEDLRQVQGGPPPRRGSRDLHEPEAQAATGVDTADCRLQIADCRLKIADCDCRVQIADCDCGLTIED
jgi:hypothetical protein